MAPAITPYQPINTLKAVADQLWIVDGPVIEFSYAGVRLPFPTRMTIVRLRSGELWVHSPTELTPGLKAEVDRLGRVRHLIAPNKLHYWWVGDWQAVCPEAMAYAAPGARERAAKRGAAFHLDLGAEPPAACAGEIDQLPVAGGFMTEIVFFHRRSRTLILSDLIENFEPDRVPAAWLRLLMRLGGVMHPRGSNATRSAPDLSRPPPGDAARRGDHDRMAAAAPDRGAWPLPSRECVRRARARIPLGREVLSRAISRTPQPNEPATRASVAPRSRHQQGVAARPELAGSPA